MTLVIGVGQAGCNIAGEIAQLPNAPDFLDIYVANSTIRDLLPLEHIPRSQWLGVNEHQGLIHLGSRQGEEEREVSGGMGKDPRRCYNSLVDAFDGVCTTLEDLNPSGHSLAGERFALIIFSGGGGTGAGAAPVIARALKEITDDTCKVLGALVLPATERGDGMDSGTLREIWNTWFSTQRSLEVFDGLVLVDNGRLSHLGDVERAFPKYNKYVAQCLTDMVLGNLTELAIPSFGDDVVVQQSDVQDLITAISIGKPGERKPGVAAVGRAAQLLRNPLGYLLPFIPPNQPDFVSLHYLAQERLTLNGNGLDQCEKAYLLARAPSDVLSRDGTGQDVSEVLSLTSERARRGEVIFGTALTERPIASVTLAMTYDPNELPKLKALEGDALQYEWEVER